MTDNIKDHDLLIRIDEKVDGIVSDVIEIKNDVKTQNGRVRKLELWRSMLIGAWALLVVGLGLWAKWG